MNIYPAAMRVKSLYVSYDIFLERVSNGILHANSIEMKTFLGNVGKNKGKEFNKRMFQLYQSLGQTNLIIHQSIKIAKGELLNYNNGNLGDIDLLLINTESKHIICIELKNYVESRNSWAFYNQEGESAHDMVQVSKRHEWCKKHIKDFHNICSSVNSSYKLKTVFLTYNLQVYKYVNKSTDPDIILMDIDEIIINPLSIFRIFDDNQ